MLYNKYYERTFINSIVCYFVGLLLINTLCGGGRYQTSACLRNLLCSLKSSGSLHSIIVVNLLISSYVCKFSITFIANKNRLFLWIELLGQLIRQCIISSSTKSIVHFTQILSDAGTIGFWWWPVSIHRLCELVLNLAFFVKSLRPNSNILMWDRVLI